MDNMKVIKINTILFFVGWTFIMLLGADFPPPFGFIWLILLILILDLIQYKYLHFFLPQLAKRKKHLFGINLAFFTIGGIVVSIFTLGITYKATIEMGMSNIIIWIAVVTIVAAIYGICFWFFNFLLTKKYINTSF
ncbi:hypothetical protein [Senegalia sp. (in: firmicutes)]|uniref:hypothetical protein n=1 Tax=Senegalia sp. (in: firmicutes) TaxID=1924098 RepID=UPI003F9474D4